MLACSLHRQNVDLIGRVVAEFVVSPPDKFAQNTPLVRMGEPCRQLTVYGQVGHVVRRSWRFHWPVLLRCQCNRQQKRHLTEGEAPGSSLLTSTPHQVLSGRAASQLFPRVPRRHPYI